MKKGIWIVLLIVIVAGVTGSAASAAKPKVQSFTVKITERGYEPASLRLRRNRPARITFLRTTDNTCAKEVVFPEFGIKRELPLNQSIVVTLNPKKNGEFRFTCGMNMMRGSLVVQ
jgi:plastocyanin domain-containing protein